MARRSTKAGRAESQPLDAEAVADEYARWLKRQPLSERSRDAYLAQVRAYLRWLAASEHGGAALAEGHVRD